MGSVPSATSIFCCDWITGWLTGREAADMAQYIPVSIKAVNNSSDILLMGGVLRGADCAREVYARSPCASRLRTEFLAHAHAGNRVANSGGTRSCKKKSPRAESK